MKATVIKEITWKWYSFLLSHLSSYVESASCFYYIVFKYKKNTRKYTHKEALYVIRWQIWRKDPTNDYGNWFRNFDIGWVYYMFTFAQMSVSILSYYSIDVMFLYTNIFCVSMSFPECVAIRNLTWRLYFAILMSVSWIEMVWSSPIEFCVFVGCCCFFFINNKVESKMIPNEK